MPDFHLLAAAASEGLQDLSTLNPASPPADSIRFLIWFLTAVSLGILFIVWGVLFYSLMRFRQKPSADDNGGPTALAEPPQVYGSMPIEIAWTVAPGLIVLVLALVILRTELEVRVAPNPNVAGVMPLNVTVIGHQWWWEYIVDRNGDEPIHTVTANEIHVPVSGEITRPVYLNLQSADVCHSFWVPRLNGKTDLIPGRYQNQTWFQTIEPGLYLGQCAEYCGAQHANMLLRVYVDTPEEFARWLVNEEAPAVDDPKVREGKEKFLSQSCVRCHTVRGTTANGKFGPELTHFAARHTLGAGMFELTSENLEKWIADPQQMKSECLMPAFGLSSQEVQSITDYLMSLK
ncbi:MAG TPA: cytochrome c oxidase subunit II [Pirellulales bacterium]|jgi:cytochrome c oxidase subunit 2